MIFKEEQKVLFSQKKKRTQHLNVKCRFLEGEVNLAFYLGKKRRGGQRFSNESGQWIIITWYRRSKIGLKI